MRTDDIQAARYDQLLVDKVPLIDVRAPAEFEKGHLPGAINLPLLENSERAEIGTLYKRAGNEAAVKRGYEIVSGDVKNQRVQAWAVFIEKNPSAVFYCFRGGLRSQISRQWAGEAGFNRPLIVGGYKAVRQHSTQKIDALSEKLSFIVLSGPTGSGKTALLAKLTTPAINLEELAHHRGSAFGKRGAQPTQANFETRLSVELLRFEQARRVVVEDESRLIGRCFLPESFFKKQCGSPVVWIDEGLEDRVQNIFEEYILRTDLGGGEQSESALKVFRQFEEGVVAISKKLGGARAQEILASIATSRNEYLGSGDLGSNKVWIKRLLTDYYDPMYSWSFENRQPQVAFRGSHKACLAYLRDGS